MKEAPIMLSADLKKLQEVANHKFKNDADAESFLKALAMTALCVWMKPDKKREDYEEDILIDSLTALIYVVE